MYKGQEDLVRPACGTITCAFTCSADVEAMIQSGGEAAIATSELMDQIITETARKHNGYVCKGKTGKFFIVFQSADQAVLWSMAVHSQLLQAKWDKSVDSVLKAATLPEHIADGSHPDLFKGPRVHIGMHSDQPTLFKFNRTSIRFNVVL